MNFKKLIILFFFTVFLFGPIKALSIENKILLKINNEIVTSLDLLNEIQYLKLINKNFENLDKEAIISASRNSLLREKIKSIELKKYVSSFEIEQEYFELLLNDFIKRLNLKNKLEFEDYISKRDMKIEFIKKKIQIEILWNQLIYNKFSKDLKIDENKIREEILINNLQKEYLLSEIVFNLDNSEKLEEKFLKIKKDIDTNNFESAALIHSISDSAKNGGKLGWIKLNSLNKRIKKNLININTENYTDPIVIPGGFLVLKIEDERETKIINNIEKEIEIIKKEIANKQLNQFSNIYFNKIKKEIQINEVR